MSTYIGQQSNWDPAADEEAQRRIKKQQQVEQDRQNPPADDEKGMEDVQDEERIKDE